MAIVGQRDSTTLYSPCKLHYFDSRIHQVTFCIDTSLIPAEYEALKQDSTTGIGLGVTSTLKQTGATSHYFAQRIKRNGNSIYWFV